jgi:hypothetical protein
MQCHEASWTRLLAMHVCKINRAKPEKAAIVRRPQLRIFVAGELVEFANAFVACPVTGASDGLYAGCDDVLAAL